MVRGGKVISAAGVWLVVALAAVLLLVFALMGCASGQSGEPAPPPSSEAPAASGEVASSEASSASAESGGESEGVSPFVGTWNYESGMEQAGATFASDSCFININADGTVDLFFIMTADDLGQPEAYWKQTGDKTIEITNSEAEEPTCLELRKKKLVMLGVEGSGFEMAFKKGEPRDLDDYRRVDFKKAVLADDDFCKVELVGFYIQPGEDATLAPPAMLADKYVEVKVTNKSGESCTFDLEEAYLDGEKLDVMASDGNIGPKRGNSAQFTYRLRRNEGVGIAPLKSVAAMYGVEATFVFREREDVQFGDLGERHVYDVSFADMKGKAKKK